MIVKSTMYIALYCPYCEEYEKIQISYFKLKKGKEYIVKSECNDSFISVMTYDYKTIYFSVSCTLCNTRHRFIYTLDSLLKDENKIFKCKLAQMDILHIGDKEYIDNIVEASVNQLRQNMDKHGFDDYITNPHIMMKVLDKIHEISKNRSLFCDCGSDIIDINLFSDRIELTCMKCNSINIIYAENYSDYEIISKRNLIVLHERSFTCLDSIHYSGKI